MTTAYPFGTVSLEVHRGPITKGCGMTDSPLDQQERDFIEYGFTWPDHTYSAYDGARFYVSGTTDVTLPERADMPRIMDERTDIFRIECESCGTITEGSIADIDVITRRFSDAHARCHVQWRDDTRTRAQLNDGCVTGCSCNGSQVTS